MNSALIDGLLSEKQLSDSGTGEHQNVRRVMMILKALSAAPSTGLRPIDVANVTGLTKASAHRILLGMADQGMVDHESSSGRFLVGMKVIGWAFSAFERFGLFEAASDVLQDLSEQTGDTAYLCLRSGDHLCCLDAREGSFPIKVVLMQIGQRIPLGIGAFGLAMLSALPSAEALAIAERMRSSHPALQQQLDAGTLAERIRRVQTDGYAVDNGDILPGISAVATIVRDQNARPLATITVAAIATRLNEPRCTQIGQLIRQAADVIESRLIGENLQRRKIVTLPSEE
jgi:DNA-binding IclR family transcriptional regulator